MNETNIVESWHDLFPFISFVFSTNLKKNLILEYYEQFILASRIKKTRKIENLKLKIPFEIWKPFFFFDGGALGAFRGEF